MSHKFMTIVTHVFDICRTIDEGEFLQFSMLIEQTKAILKFFDHGDATEEVATEIENDLTDDDKVATEKAKARRPALNLYEMGMQKGDRLLWKEDPSISVVVSSERKVLYKDEEYSLSALSAQLKGYNVKHIAPGKYWTYKEKSLDDIYDETYPFDE